MLYKKHFKQIAEIINSIDNTEMRRQLYEKFKTFCERNNPNFDAAKFHEACEKDRNTERDLIMFVNGFPSLSHRRNSTGVIRNPLFESVFKDLSASQMRSPDPAPESNKPRKRIFSRKN